MPLVLKISALASLMLVGASLVGAQPIDSRIAVERTLGFEDQTSSLLTGWSIGGQASIRADSIVAHSGRWSVRLERDNLSTGTRGGIARSIPIEFLGKTVEIRGYLRLENVTGFAGLVLREDADGESLRFVNMREQQISGTRDWEPYSISAPLDPRAQTLVFGVEVAGKGILWADDLEIRVDGKSLIKTNVSKRAAGLPEDHEFDAGSNISIIALTPIQIANLATLCRVWGFVKYHHPVITGGRRHWDYELLRIIPSILAATNRTQANDELAAWIEKIGPIHRCSPCIRSSTVGLNEIPPLKWIYDSALLGRPLSRELQQIYVNRTGKQFYVSSDLAGGPLFEHELSYRQILFPDAGYQLLALFRWWNIMQYWSPYREVAKQDWGDILSVFIPKIATAQNRETYELALAELIAKANDSHASLMSSEAVLPPLGNCTLPAAFRFVGNEATVSRVDEKNAPVSPGDVINAIDDTSISALINS